MTGPTMSTKRNARDAKRSATHIVITSIFSPGEAIRRFSRIKGHQLTVVGDLKTPKGWSHAGVRFIAAGEQARLSFRLGRHLPWNHYSRKMLGYLDAMREGATVIVDTDDDNIPYWNWKFPAFDGIQSTTEKNRGFINVYSLYSDQHIWPRGLPLDLVLARDRKAPGGKLRRQQSRVGVWQSLANGDPDVDAVYRLTSNRPCRFKKRRPVVLAEGTLSPFNSQNTAFRREVFPLLYLPVTVTFRFTDILRGLVAQPILWAANLRLGFTTATVVQERNPHDYMKDFLSEIPCYLHARNTVELTRTAVKKNASISENLHRAYTALRKASIVQPAELKSLEAWLHDVARLEK
jgi:hypothetical protein